MTAPTTPTDPMHGWIEGEDRSPKPRRDKDLDGVAHHKMLGEVPAPAGMPEMLPCPFCGGKAALEFIPGIRSPINRWGARCTNIECGPISLSEAEAVEWWNRRAALATTLSNSQIIAIAYAHGFDDRGSDGPHQAAVGEYECSDAVIATVRACLAAYEAGCTAQASERDAILEEAITALERAFDIYTPYQISQGRALARCIEVIQAIKSKKQGSAK